VAEKGLAGEEGVTEEKTKRYLEVKALFQVVGTSDLQIIAVL